MFVTHCTLITNFESDSKFFKYLHKFSIINTEQGSKKYKEITSCTVNNTEYNLTAMFIGNFNEGTIQQIHI